MRISQKNGKVKSERVCTLTIPKNTGVTSLRKHDHNIIDQRLNRQILVTVSNEVPQQAWLEKNGAVSCLFKSRLSATQTVTDVNQRRKFSDLSHCYLNSANMTGRIIHSKFISNHSSDMSILWINIKYKENNNNRFQIFSPSSRCILFFPVAEFEK